MQHEKFSFKIFAHSKQDNISLLYMSKNAIKSVIYHGGIIKTKTIVMNPHIRKHRKQMFHVATNTKSLNKSTSIESSTKVNGSTVKGNKSDDDDDCILLEPAIVVIDITNDAPGHANIQLEKETTEIGTNTSSTTNRLKESTPKFNISRYPIRSAHSVSANSYK